MEDEQVASHSEDVQQEPQESVVSDALALFGLDTPSVVEDPAGEVEQEDEPEIDPPAIEESKKLIVKVDKQDREVSDDEIPELVQKGFGLDKERARREKYESALTRAAKLAGYDKVDDYLTDLDTIEQQAVKQKEDSFNTLRQEMIDEYTAAGWDPTQLESFLDNHPLLAQAKEVMEREKATQEAQKQQQTEQAKLQGWQDLFAKYPQLTEELPADGSAAPWFTPEMQRLVNDRHYDPIDAYRLVHSDKIIADERKRTEQDVIKQQRLNKRAKVETDAPADDETAVPNELSSAFALFGLDPKAAKKYIKK
ncbi:hypothetical protein A3842_11185 [Paenibacillus sp. P3E]|uniref:hypothetical protein n=1 Tax=Paenibacillus sp. P3E TaxID=1349435 RepID=UPI00093DEF0A|nr:hypothetical protein [Paenibacillus sp. P3E]OKP81634.1 hypothetical protein A3842_11185 [Paenibacillus sp. P3E]